jgi:hypothetical protein
VSSGRGPQPLTCDGGREVQYWEFQPYYVIQPQSDGTIPAGTTYSVTFKFNPCPGARNIPTGTTVTLTAELYHSARKNPDGNGVWDGRVDYTGALRTTSVSSSCC